MTGNNWPQPDDTGRYVIKPSPLKLGRWILLMAAIALTGLLVQRSANPVLHDKGIGFALGGGALALLMLYKLLNGGYTLSLDDNGFTIGTRRYSWDAAQTGFNVAALGRQGRVIRFGAPDAQKQIANIYPLSPDALAVFLNTQARAHLDSTAQITPATASPPRKTLSPRVWGVIIALFIVLMQNGGSIAEALWRIAAPASYTAKMLNDEALGDQIGWYHPGWLPFLLARANAGDKSAMFFTGDLYDPTDFTCETAVAKNADTAVYWYRRAVVLDDEGAERNLGILYREGVGVPHDDIEAAALFELSVTHHNDDIGDYELGQMLENGIGEPADMPRAVALERASAAQGNALGETELGRMYLTGTGVPQDNAQAAHYLQLAAAQGNRTARSLLTVIPTQ